MKKNHRTAFLLVIVFGIGCSVLGEMCLHSAFSMVWALASPVEQTVVIDPNPPMPGAVFIGSNAGTTITTGSNNIIFGYKSKESIETGAEEPPTIEAGHGLTAVGYDAGGATAGLSDCVFIGHEAGLRLSDGSHSYVFIGPYAGAEFTGAEEECPVFVLNDNTGRTVLSINKKGEITALPQDELIKEFKDHKFGDILRFVKK